MRVRAPPRLIGILRFEQASTLRIDEVNWVLWPVKLGNRRLAWVTVAELNFPHRHSITVRDSRRSRHASDSFQQNSPDVNWRSRSVTAQTVDTVMSKWLESMDHAMDLKSTITTFRCFPKGFERQNAVELNF